MVLSKKMFCIVNFFAAELLVFEINVLSGRFCDNSKSTVFTFGTADKP